MKITNDRDFYKAQYEREVIFESVPEGDLDQLSPEDTAKLGELTSAISDYQEEMNREEPEELDKYHWHEVIDRTDLMRSMFEDFIMSHPVITQNPSLKGAGDKVQDALTALYVALNGQEPEG